MKRLLFFTDPHLLAGEDYTIFYEKLELLKEYAQKFNVCCVICGGDWLGNGDSHENAIKKLKHLNQYTHQLFNKYYPVLGNHDTNYQGVDQYGRKNSGKISEQTLIDILFAEQGSINYTFYECDTSFYVFDCGIDWDYNLLSDERIRQIHWLAQGLLNEKNKNYAVIMHSYFISGSDLRPTVFANLIGKCITAYNQRAQFLFSGISYDFSKCKGIVNFILSGHVHKDVVQYLQGNIPVITLTKALNTALLTFDILEIDYDNKKLKLRRIGDGEDREVDLPR